MIHSSFIGLGIVLIYRAIGVSTGSQADAYIAEILVRCGGSELARRGIASVSGITSFPTPLLIPLPTSFPTPLPIPLPTPTG